MRQAWLVTSGAVLCVLGLVIAVRAALLMYDTTTTTQVSMLREFGVGVCVVGWGFVAVIPNRWRRSGFALASLGTVAIVVTVMLMSQGVPA
jgi:dipeptide/tripeptide permease